MNNLVKHLGSFLLLLLLLTTATNLEGQKRCGTQILHNEKLENDPQYKQQFNAYEKKMTKLYKEVASRQKAACANPVFYPIAIHYDWVPSAADQVELIKLAQNQVATMNAAFNGNDCVGGANTNCFEFVIATTGHPTGSGLTDGAPAVTFGGTAGADYCPTDNGDVEPCDLSRWGGYMNITVNRLSAANRCSSLGIAQLGSDPSIGQSMAVNACAFGSTGIVASGTAGVLDGVGGDAECDCLEGTIDKGITTTHEIGHMLGLYHTFCADNGAIGPYAGTAHSGTIAAGVLCEEPAICATGCNPNGANPNPWSSGTTPAGSGPYKCDCDRLEDTPAQAYSSSGCPTTGTTVPNASESGSPSASFNNFMDYGDDACLSCFTPNQYTAIQATTIANPGYKTRAQTVMTTTTAPTVSVDDACSCENGSQLLANQVAHYKESVTITGTAGATVEVVTNTSMKNTNGVDVTGTIGTIPASGTLTFDYFRLGNSAGGPVTLEIGGVSATVRLGACTAFDDCRTVTIDEACDCRNQVTIGGINFFKETLTVTGVAGDQVNCASCPGNLKIDIIRRSVNAARIIDLGGTDVSSTDNLGTIPVSSTFSYEYLRPIGSAAETVTLNIGGTEASVMLGACSTAEQCEIALVPTMGQWALFILGLLMSSLALVYMHKRLPVITE